MKEFKGKALYQPKGKAGEYSHWACNFFVGCSNGCEYCFLKKGIGKATLGGDTPTLKKCFSSESEALEIFEKELNQNLEELQKHGLFFSFTTDPMLPETIELTWNAMAICLNNNVPVKILTKCTWWIDRMIQPYCSDGVNDFTEEDRRILAVGFTLTGHNELERNASSNESRIDAMRKLHRAGFKTWASIEPIITFDQSRKMILSSCDCCDLYKIGLESGQKYDKESLIAFVRNTYVIRENYKGMLQSGDEIKIYFKDSLLKQAGINREDLPENCVGRDYNMFTTKK